VTNSTSANKRFAAMLARRNNNEHLGTTNYYPGRRNSSQHFLLSSSTVILFGFSCRHDIMKHSSKPMALAETAFETLYNFEVTKK
jgi:hypothetical protein